MTIVWNFPPFSPDARGTKLKSYAIKDRDNGEQSLLLCCADEHFAQVVALMGDACYESKLTPKGMQDWTHSLRFPRGVPDYLPPFLDLLIDTVTLGSREGINIGMSVDWHKEQNDEGYLVNTDMGRRIQFTKYAKYPSGSGSRQAWRELIASMAEFIRRHPFYAWTKVITSPPGHNADGNSFGEQLARAVAKATDKAYIEMTAAGPRPEQKEAGQRDLSDEFTLSQRINEPIIIIDDVFHTGATLDAAAQAARRAGATEVMTLTATRTLRK